jgi:hypothetical protein
LHPHWFTKTFRSNVADGSKEHDKQCTYNVTLRRVDATIDAVEKQEVLHTLRSWLRASSMIKLIKNQPDAHQF